MSTWILIHQADNRYMYLMTEWKARRENIGLRYQFSTLHIVKIKDYQDKKQLFHSNIYLVKTSCLLHMLDNTCKNINQLLVICKTRQIYILALKSDSKDWLHTREISLCLKRVPCGKPLMSTWILIHQANNIYMYLMTEWKARQENIGSRLKEQKTEACRTTIKWFYNKNFPLLFSPNQNKKLTL